MCGCSCVFWVFALFCVSSLGVGDLGMGDMFYVSRDFVLTWLVPPTLYDLGLKDPESIDVSLSKFVVRFRRDVYTYLVRGFEIARELWPECIRYTRGEDEGFVGFRFVGRFRHHLRRAYFLSRLARSKVSLLGSWIAVREYLLDVLNSLERGSVSPLAINVDLSDTVRIDERTLRNYGVTVSLSLLANVLSRRLNVAARLAAGVVYVPVGASLRYMLEITSELTPERFLLMELICMNAPIHTYAIVRDASEYLLRRKSWVYQSMKVLEKHGLILRLENLCREARGGRMRKVVLPSCMAWYYAPCILELPNFGVVVELKGKPLEFSCMMGYREDEIFHRPNMDSLRNFIDRLSELNVRVPRDARERLESGKARVIMDTPCPIFRRALEILYDLIKKAQIAGNLEIKMRKREGGERWNMLELINSMCRMLGIPFSIEPLL